MELAKDKKIKSKIVSNWKLSQMTNDPNFQHLVLVTSPLTYKKINDYQDFKKNLQNKNKNLFVVLEGINDPQNMGSIIRNCNFLGVNAIICNIYFII